MKVLTPPILEKAQVGGGELSYQLVGNPEYQLVLHRSDLLPFTEVPLK